MISTLANGSFQFDNCSFKYREYFRYNYWYLSFQIIIGLPVIIIGIFGHVVIVMSFRKPAGIICKHHMKMTLLTYNYASMIFLVSMIPKLFFDKLAYYINLCVISSLISELSRIASVGITGMFALQRMSDLLRRKMSPEQSNKQAVCILASIIVISLLFSYFYVLIITYPMPCDQAEYFIDFILMDSDAFKNSKLFSYVVTLMIYQSVCILSVVASYFITMTVIINQLGSITVFQSQTDPQKDYEYLITDSMRFKAQTTIFIMFLIFVVPVPILQLILVSTLNDKQFMKFQVIVVYLYVVNSSASAFPFFYFYNPIRQNMGVFITKRYWKQLIGIESDTDSFNSDTLRSLISFKKSDEDEDEDDDKSIEDIKE